MQVGKHLSTQKQSPALFVGILTGALCVASGSYASGSSQNELAWTSPEAGPVLDLAQSSGAPPKPKKCKKRRGKFHFQFEEAKIIDVLKQISVLTCKNFIVSEGVKGKTNLTIISRTPVTVNQAYSAFLSALEANNMALVPAGRFYKVVQRKEAAKQALPMYEKKGDGSYGEVKHGEYITYNDAHVTYMFELKYASKDQVQPLLKNLMSKTGDLQIIGQNLIIVTDSASNIRRLVSILERVDVTGAGSRIHIVQIEFAEAAGISKKLTDIFDSTSVRSGKKKSKQPSSAGSNAAGKQAGDEFEEVNIDKIIADERTNKLIILSSNSAFQHVKELIDILDVPSEVSSSESRVYVHPLNNADSQKMASTLTTLSQGQGKSKKSKKKKKGGDAQAATLFEGDVKVTGDEATNSLVIIASPKDYRSLKSVIEELDVRRPQVFVEAAVLEVSLNRDRQLGIDAYSGLPVTVPGFEGQGLGFIANEGGQGLITSSATLFTAQTLLSNANTTGVDVSQLSAAAESATGLETMLGWLAFHGPPVPGSEDVFGFPVPSFGMVLNALENNASVDVLSTPHIMTTDNEKAEISVGERIPVVKGISNFAGGGALGFGGLQQVSYEDVKLKFTVTPHVNADDEIRLELEQEVSALGGNIPVGNGLSQPIITNRSANTTVVVSDQQTVVIGGLISTRGADSERKFPILGDIPIIGWLVKDWNDSESKTNLIIVITPYVVRTKDDFRKIYDRKIQERKDFIEAYYGVTESYSPHIDYDKKNGPLSELVEVLDYELLKVENGGPGLPGESLITPELSIVPFDESEKDSEPNELEDNAPDADGNASPETIDAPPSAAPASDTQNSDNRSDSDGATNDPE
jgi:general secretion pathway protein D